MKNIKNNALESLYLSADEDLYRRLVSLEIEANNILNITNFYLNSQDKNIRKSQFNFLKESSILTETLIGEVKHKMEDYEKYLVKYGTLKNFKRYTLKNQTNQDFETRDLYLKNKYILQVAIRHEAKSIAKHLGYINENLGQRLESIELEDPAPTVRRAFEKGFISEYLRRLTKNTNRDLIIFISSFLNCDVPYRSSKTVPVTFQYWAYTENYFSEFYRNEEAKKFHKSIRDGEKINHEEAKSYNTVIMSFWNIDFPELYSVIAHEISHLLLLDITNNLDIATLSKADKYGILGGLARRLSAIFSNWIPSEINDSLKIEVEIMADLLGAAQFGFAYLYAWFIEMFVNDSYVISHYLDDQQNLFSISTFLENDESYLPSELLENFSPRYSDMAIYLRGRAMLKAINAIFPKDKRKEDDLENNFLDAFQEHVELVLETRYSSVRGDMKNDLWRVIGNEVDKAIDKSKFSSAAANYNIYRVTKNNDVFKYQNIRKNIRKYFRKKYTNKPTYFRPDIEKNTCHSINLPYRILLSDYIDDYKDLNKKHHHDFSEFTSKFKENSYKRKKIIHVSHFDYLYSSSNISYLYLLRNLPVKSRNKKIEITTEDKNILENVFYTIPDNKGLSSFEKCKNFKDLYDSYDKVKIFFEDKYNKFPNSLLEDYDYPHSWCPSILDDNLYAFDLILGESPKDIKSLSDAIKCKSGEILKSSITYGRYDFFSIKKCPYALFSSPDEKYRIRRDGGDDYIMPKVRRRLIRKINYLNFFSSGEVGFLENFSVEEMDSKKPQVVLMITLLDKGLSNDFIHIELMSFVRSHLKKKGKRKLLFQAYLSEGTEDIILELHKNDCFNKLGDFIEFSESIYNNRFVSRTETIITTIDNIETKDVEHYLKGIKLSLGLRLRPDFKTNRFLEKYKEIWGGNKEISPKIYQLSGKIDYMIEFNISNLNGDKIEKITDFRSALIKETELSRINTQLYKNINSLIKPS